MNTNFIASMVVSTMLLAVSAGAVLALPGTISAPHQTASHISWQ